MVNVIIIDDERDLVDALGDYFKEMKMKVVGNGHNGKEGIELYDKHRPDVILMDIDMPVYDGRFAI